MYLLMFDCLFSKKRRNSFVFLFLERIAKYRNQDFYCFRQKSTNYYRKCLHAPFRGLTSLYATD